MVFVTQAASAVTIYDIQYTTDPSGDSPYAGQVVTVTGIVTAVTYDGYVIAEAPGSWHAIFVYSAQRHGPRVGDEIEITGTVSEYYNMTEIGDVTSYTLLSSGNEIAAWIVTAQNASQEMYESVLVTISNLTVTLLGGSGEWTADDGTGTIRCDNWNDYMYFPQLGDELDSVTGFLIQFFTTFKLEPRNTADIAGDVIPHFAIGGDVVTMNATLDILEDHYVEIQGDRILGITPAPPPGVLTVETGGLVLPGLIDSHNHARYNVLGHIPFGRIFEDRQEWRSSEVYGSFSLQFQSIRDYGGSYAQIRNLYRLAEARALSAGTTTIQGVNCNADGDDFFAHQGMVINNAERFPSCIWSDTFPLPNGQIFWNNMANQFWDRFVIHLSEGISDDALQEFYIWQDDWEMLDRRTSIIHGVPYDVSEWQLMADADASLIWSPTSNVVLYGVSPDIPAALAAGVNVAIAPDWTESGSRNMLEELKFGNELNMSLWGGVIEPVQFALFATRNGAYAMGAEDRIGQIVPEFQADLMVIPGDPQDPYQALLEANPEDVKLTVVSGRPMYGDVDLMAQFPFLGDVEAVTVCEQPKTLAIQIDAHSIPDSDKPIALVISDLQEAYDHSFPQICDFLGPFDCQTSGAMHTPWLASRSLRVYPNPSHDLTTLSFTLTQRGPACLKVYDLNGRILRTLVNRSLDSGEYTVLWDGRDDNGLRLASGIYPVRLSLGVQTQTGKVLLTR
jgi:cytosine/adenosine deaminase-related metal-dependent hydrolase